MELGALKKTGKDNERLIENLLAEKEDSIRQITELRQEIKRLRSNIETSNCDRLLPGRQRSHHELRRLSRNDNQRPVKYISLEVEKINADCGKYQLQRFSFSVMPFFKDNHLWSYQEW